MTEKFASGKQQNVISVLFRNAGRISLYQRKQLRHIYSIEPSLELLPVIRVACSFRGTYRWTTSIINWSRASARKKKEVEERLAYLTSGFRWSTAVAGIWSSCPLHIACALWKNKEYFRLHGMEYCEWSFLGFGGFMEMLRTKASILEHSCRNLGTSFQIN